MRADVAQASLHLGHELRGRQKVLRGADSTRVLYRRNLRQQERGCLDQVQFPDQVQRPRLPRGPGQGRGVGGVLGLGSEADDRLEIEEEEGDDEQDQQEDDDEDQHLPRASVLVAVAAYFHRPTSIGPAARGQCR